MTAPADRLREAAAKVRETAGQATPGPWTFQAAAGSGWLVERQPPGDYAVAMAPRSNPRRDYDAQWIALASPALAEHWAALLEAVADDLDLIGAENIDASTYPVFSQALALADVILGGAS